MANCVCCGSWIPDGQGDTCSMCEGNINHGSDGYYQDVLEKERRKHEEQLEEERQQEESEQFGNNDVNS